MKLKYILKISRPRFWIYLTGPYLLGLAASYPNISNLWITVLFGLYFTFPGNLLLYGINDIFDFETDKLNPKKEEYENKVKPEQRRHLYIAIAITNLPFFFFSVFAPLYAFYSFVAFLFFSIFYSAEPIRAKTKPFLDSFFNVLYIFPGFFSYFLTGDTKSNFLIFLAGTCWVMAMHAYSAVPDIESDLKSGIETIATKLGAKKTLILCLLLYLLSAGLSYPYLKYISLLFALIYFTLIIISVNRLDEGVMQIYKYFPWVNTSIGFIIFWYLIFFL